MADECTSYDETGLGYDSSMAYDGICAEVVIGGVPDLLIEIAFDTDPFDVDPVWTDVTEDFRNGAEIQRGRRNELDRMETGTCVLSLDNRTRSYDPTNTTGPYYPKVLPRKRLRFRATSGGATYTIFDGYVSAWQPVYPNPTDSWVEVSATDLFGVLALVPIPEGTTFAAQSSGDRINALLDLLPVPTEWRDIDDGASSLIEDSPTTSVLEAIQQVAETEGGVCFVSGSGIITFRARTTLFNTAVDPAIFGDDLDAELPYVALAPSYDETLLYNRVVVTPKGGTEETSDDAGSQTSYGIRTLSISDVLLTQSDALDRADGLLNLYKEPLLRFPSMTLDGREDTGLWAEVLGNEVYDRKIVRRRPPPLGEGDVIERSVVIEGLSHSITPPNEWMTSYQLGSDPSDFSTFWKLEDPVQGEIDSTYVFAY